MLATQYGWSRHCVAIYIVGTACEPFVCATKNIHWVFNTPYTSIGTHRYTFNRAHILSKVWNTVQWVHFRSKRDIERGVDAIGTSKKWSQSWAMFYAVPDVEGIFTDLNLKRELCRYRDRMDVCNAWLWKKSESIQGRSGWNTVEYWRKESPLTGYLRFSKVDGL